MILRRFMQHVREQNWFAVGLDVIVVIVGIFLGLQVQNWYEDQQNRIDEETYLQRLHLEVSDALVPAHLFMELRRVRHNDLREVIDLLQRDDPNDQISPQQCQAILSSNTLVSSAAVLPTMDELLATGNISIISNDEVRNAISLYNNRLPFIDGVRDQLSRTIRSMMTGFPDFFVIDMTMVDIPATVEEFGKYNHICKLDLMRTNTRFKNELTYQAAGLKAYIDIYHGTQVELLTNLQKALETALGDEYEAREPNFVQ